MEEPIPRFSFQCFLLSQQEVESCRDFSEVNLAVWMLDTPNLILFQGRHLLYWQFLQGCGRYIPLQQQAAGRPQHSVTEICHRHKMSICVLHVDLRQHFFQIFQRISNACDIILSMALSLQGRSRCTCHCESTKDGHAETASIAKLWL